MGTGSLDFNLVLGRFNAPDEGRRTAVDLILAIVGYAESKFSCTMFFFPIKTGLRFVESMNS
jgi:hypothetical protein